MRRIVAAALAAACAFALSGCRVDVGVRTAANVEGSGRITVEVKVDEAVRDALSEPGLEAVAALFGKGDAKGVGDAFADLRRSGWNVDAAEGVLTLTHDFSAPSQVAGLFRQLGGDDPESSVFAQVRLVRSAGVWSTKLRMVAQVDLAPDRVVALVARDAVSPPTAAEIESLAGRPLAELVTMRFVVDLPGSPVVVERSGNTAKQVAPAQWSIAPGQRLDATVSTDAVNPTVWIAAGAVAVSAVLAALVVWRRRRS